MLKKEFKDVLKQVLFFFGGVLLATLFLYITLRLLDSTLGFGDLFYPVYQLGLLTFGLFLGLSLFARDSQDRGMEYLLTLPFSRLRLLWLKTFPRLSALLVCYALYALILAVSKNVDMQLLHLPGLLGLSLSLFIIGQSFSAFRGNFIVAAMGALFSFIVFLASIHLIYPTMEMIKLEWKDRLSELLRMYVWWEVPVVTYIAGFGILVAFAAAFIHAFKKFHLGTSRGFIKRYMKVFVPITAAALVISLIGSYAAIKPQWQSYHLTTGHQLIEYDYGWIRIYTDEGEYKLEGIPRAYPRFVEKDNILYMKMYSKDYRTQNIVRLDPKEQKVEELYKPAPGFVVGYKMFRFKETLAFFEWNRSLRGERPLVIFNTVTREQKRVTFQVPARTRRYDLMVFGAGEIAGKRFWIVHSASYHGYRTYRVWEKTGEIEDLGLSDIRPYYVNGRLIIAREGSIRIGSVSENGFNEIKTLDINLDGSFKLYTGDGINMEYLPVNEIYGSISDRETHTWKRHVKLDLETLEFQDIKGLDKDYGQFAYHRSGTWYYAAMEYVKPGKPANVKLYRLNNGVPELLKDFGPLRLFYGGNDNFGIYPGGVLLKKGDDFTMYNLPDMKEFKIKGL